MIESIMVKSIEVKVPEYSEEIKNTELGGRISGAENLDTKIDELIDLRMDEFSEIFQENHLPIDDIMTKSLQQLIEENNMKFDMFKKVVNDLFECSDVTENDNVLDSDKINDDEDLTEDEINERQRSEIKNALEKIFRGEKLTKEELGNLGEMMMDQYYISQGYKPLNTHRVTGLNDKKDGFKTGIDGVYEKTNPDGTKLYVIADAKYNTSQLSETNDGKQMSDNWIDKRLDDAVGKEKADEIRDASEDNSDSVSHEVYHIDPTMDENGNIHTDIQNVDSDGNKYGDKNIVEYFDRSGNRIELIYKS